MADSTQSQHHIDPDDYPGLCATPAVELRVCGGEASRQLGRYLARETTPGDFLGLVGNLGAGKTTLVQGLVEELDPDGKLRATSPTYALVQVYETTPRIYHMDLYRLEGWADLESIGYWDVVDSPAGICCVEWLDRIPAAWPGRGLIVELSGSGPARRARLWTDDDWAERIETLNDHSINASSRQE